jgi:hypothetical protein
MKRKKSHYFYCTGIMGLSLSWRGKYGYSISKIIGEEKSLSGSKHRHESYSGVIKASCSFSQYW